jgi:hypothetical protein
MPDVPPTRRSLIPTRRLLLVLPAFVATTAVALVACGGGSDGSSSGGAAGVAAPATIDGANYKAASATVLEAGFGVADVDLSAMGSVVDLGNANNKSSASRAVAASLKAFDTLRRAKGDAGSGASKRSLNCTGGGTLTIDASVTRPGTNVTGDRFAFTYDNCIDLTGRSETDGTIELVLTHVGLGDFRADPAYEVRLTYTLTQLRTIDTTGTRVADGSMEIESVRTAVRQGYDRVAVPRLETSFTPLAGARTWSRIDAFAARSDHTPATTTTTIDGTISGSDGLNEGSVTVDTTTPFVRAPGRYPHAGVLTATGDQRSRLEVRAIDDTTVRLSADADGDGVYETVEDVAWSSIW